MSCINYELPNDEDLPVWRFFYEAMCEMMKHHYNDAPEGMMLFTNIQDGEDLYPFAIASERTGIKFKVKIPAYTPDGKWLHKHKAVFIDAKDQKQWIAFANATSLF